MVRQLDQKKPYPCRLLGLQAKDFTFKNETLQIHKDRKSINGKWGVIAYGYGIWGEGNENVSKLKNGSTCTIL